MNKLPFAFLEVWKTQTHSNLICLLLQFLLSRVIYVHSGTVESNKNEHIKHEHEHEHNKKKSLS